MRHTLYLLGVVNLQSIILSSLCRGCEAFSESCLKALEPEDVTVGLVIGKGLRYTFMVLPVYA